MAGLLKTGSYFRLLFFLSFVLEPLCISCVNKPLYTPSISSETSNPKSVDNLLQEAFLSYQQGQLTEVSQKLEAAVNLVPKNSPTSLVATLYTISAFFQKKSGDPVKATTTFKIVQGLFRNLKDIRAEFETLSRNLRQFALLLELKDRLQFWETLRPIVKDSIGKAAEADVTCQIAETYNGLKNFQKAYDLGVESRQLARESGELAAEVHASIVISMGLIGLGRFQEAEGFVQEVFSKTKDNPILRALILGVRGTVYGALGRGNLAIDDFQEATTLARSLGDMNLLARLQLSLGIAYLSTRNPQAATQEFLKAISHFERLKDELSVANVEGMIAQAYFGTHNFEEANKHALRAAELFRQLGNRSEEAKNLRLVGQSLIELEKLEEGFSILRKAVDIQVEEKDREEALKTFWLSIGLLERLGHIEDIKNSLLMALDANARFFGNKEVEAMIRGRLGEVYRELGVFSDALEQSSQAFSLHQELSNTRAQVSIQLQIASIYGNVKDYESQLVALNLANQIGATLDDPNVKQVILNGIAEAFETLGDTVEALQSYLKALEISREISKQHELSQLKMLGMFYYRVKEYDRAQDCFGKALALAKEIDDRNLKAKVLGWIGLIDWTSGQFEDAMQKARESLDILRATKADKSDKRFSLIVIGAALSSQGRYEEAQQANQELLQLSLETQKPYDIEEAYEILGYVFLKSGKFAEALEAYKKAATWRENIWNVIRGQEAFLKWLLLPYDGIVEAIYHLYSAAGPEKSRLAEEALYFADMGKSMTLRELISAERSRFVQDAVPLEIRKKEEDVLNQALATYSAYTSALSRYRIPEDELKEKTKAWEDAFEKQKGFIEELGRRYPKYANLRYPKAYRLQELAIRDEETLIMYKVGVGWTYAWVLRKVAGRNEIVKFTRLPVMNTGTVKLVEKFLAPFQNVKYEQFASNTSTELFKVILQPVLEGVTLSKRLVIVPDGILAIVPFEALVTQGDEGLQNLRFLGDQHSIGYYPSTTILTINRQTIPPALPPEGSLLAVGDPVYGPDDERLTPSQMSLLRGSEPRQGSEILSRTGKVRKEAQDQGFNFGRLKHSGTEVVKVSKVFGNREGPRDVLIGLEASESRVKSKDLKQYQYLHFATHGILANDVPYLKEPALVLAHDPDGKEDGFLTYSEVIGLELNADLVTLSACKTGLGQLVPGEGVIGLSWAFMFAGARALIVSLWEVDDHSTALLMEEFYRLLAQGVNKVEALAKAKDHLRQKGYENPYFWAPFILIGD
jgi:CHAT domain-containing protein/tetratricopeptide (TPR) repeat protein